MMKRRLYSKLLILNDRREVDVAVVALPIDFLVKGGLLIVPHVEMTLAYKPSFATRSNEIVSFLLEHFLLFHHTPSHLIFAHHALLRYRHKGC
jgi:hypothetical protein